MAKFINIFLIICLLLLATVYTFNTVNNKKEVRQLIEDYTEKIETVNGVKDSVNAVLLNNTVKLLEVQNELSLEKRRSNYMASINRDAGLQIADTLKYIQGLESKIILLTDSVNRVNDKYTFTLFQAMVSRNKTYRFNDDNLSVNMSVLEDDIRLNYSYKELVNVETDITDDLVSFSSTGTNPNSTIVVNNNVNINKSKSKLIENLFIGTSINYYDKKYSPGIVGGLSNNKYAGFLNFTRFENKSMISLGAHINF